MKKSAGKISSELPSEFYSSVCKYQNYLNEIAQRTKSISDLNDEYSIEDLQKNIIACYSSIKKNQKIGDLYFEAFLCSPAPLDNPHYNLLTEFRAHILMAATHLMRRQEYESDWKMALDHARLICVQEEWSIIPFLPSLRKDLKEVAAELRANSRECGRKLSARLQSFALIFERYLSETIKRRSILDARAGKGTKSIEIQASALDSSLGSMTELYIEKDNSYLGESLEMESFQEQTESRVMRYEPSEKSITRMCNAKAKRASEAVAKIIVRNEKQTAFSYYSLSNMELQILLHCLARERADYTHENWDLENKRRHAIDILYVALLTGRTIAEISRRKLSRAEKIQYNKFRKSDDFHKKVFGGKFYMPISLGLPNPTSRHLSYEKVTSTQFLEYGLYKDGLSVPGQGVFAVSKEQIDAVGSYLASINKEYKTKITLGKVSHYMEYWMKRRGVDPVFIALIKHRKHIYNPGIHYSCVQVGDLQRIYDRYASHLASLCTEFKPDYPKRGEEKIGSQFVLKSEAVKEDALWLRNQVDKSETLFDFHNAFSRYVVFCLMLATGQRPVGDPFGGVDDIDLNRGLIIISDKENMQGSSARVIPLSQIAMDLLKGYLTFLEHLKSLKKKTFLSLRANQALTGKASLFFLANKKKAIRFSYLEDLPVGFRKLNSYKKANWNRHFMRTQLLKEVDGGLIDSWMGHGQSGHEPFSKYSGFSLKRLSKLLPVIDEIMTNLGACVVEPKVGV